mmetsp:Transcript_10243/g.23195  ORF Transcript_10243/g.23195 Transcript_10243/m.23195 type:complete len:226 (-) Transcript_10243:2633-3310(-)
MCADSSSNSRVLRGGEGVHAISMLLSRYGDMNAPRPWNIVSKARTALYSKSITSFFSVESLETMQSSASLSNGGTIVVKPLSPARPRLRAIDRKQRHAALGRARLNVTLLSRLLTATNCAAIAGKHNSITGSGDAFPIHLQTPLMKCQATTCSFTSSSDGALSLNMSLQTCIITSPPIFTTASASMATSSSDSSRLSTLSCNAMPAADNAYCLAPAVNFQPEASS